MEIERKSGILLHITSLPSRYGIGTIGKEAYEFVDFLVAANQKLWQILPLNPTGFGDSPYQSFSAFAGNPLLISLEDLVERGYLKREELDIIASDNDKIDYGRLYEIKFPLLRKTYLAFLNNENNEFTDFCDKNAFWLDDYSIFMALKKLNSKSWYEWDENLRQRKNLTHIPADLENEAKFHKFLQYIFFSQWKKLKSYANSKGIKIIGDIPIFVSPDSADVWANPEIFQLDENLLPIKVAGVPPDYFSATGQLWGNPLYRWDKIKLDRYRWWIDRFRISFELFDYIRVDHFRGFCGYWAIPYGEKTAINGKWENGPGEDLFNVLKESHGELPIIAEDLGIITPDVIELREKFSFPGMKVLQFGFEDGTKSEHLPHNFVSYNFVAYTGTHDNDTLLGWLMGLSKEKKNFLKSYLNLFEKDDRELTLQIIRLLWMSVAKFVIIPIQDIFLIDSSGRMNIPGNPYGNWQWKSKKEMYDEKAITFLKEITSLYNR
ncbi:MAG: 4-alpha-glucanotransferase [Brevinematia bacterium]